MQSEYGIRNNIPFPDTLINIFDRDSVLSDSAWNKIWETDILEDISKLGEYEVYIISHSYGPSYSPVEWYIIAQAIHIPIGIDDDLPALVNNYELRQNHPNPFNPVTTIEYSLPRSGEVSLIIFNLLGEEVARLVDGFQPAGEHNTAWNASNVSSGIYFYRLGVGNFVETKKMILLK